MMAIWSRQHRRYCDGDIKGPGYRNKHLSAKWTHVLMSFLVTYNDTSSVYPLISQSLHERLPLRNLNWNTHARPFRSIPTLNVELVRDVSADKQSDGDWAIDADEAQDEFSGRGRRHQIPGLGQSPYLKIYFLQCDDLESYRATCRQHLRDWISSNTVNYQSSVPAIVKKQHHHDAFEWLVVHVIPQPADGSSPSASNDRNENEGYKRPSSLRWSSRASNMTVLDKVKADFNGSSKNAVDRVVQVIVQDNNTGWDDLVSKMKSLILASFDLRVTQYEEDIKEKEMQQKLPGWNFNTFFVLKEGLARGFESVGLLEDALIGYHELSTGLTATVEDGGNDDMSAQSAHAFSLCTDELNAEFSVCSARMDGETQEHVVPMVDFGASILDTGRKDFRHLILANSISVFDFRCYIFARQVALLLRLATTGKDPTMSNDYPRSATNDISSTNPSDQGLEDLSILAEICSLAAEFISSGAARMREEFTAMIQTMQTSKGKIDGVRAAPADVCDNLIASWTYSTSQAVLEATKSQNLSVQLHPLLGRLRSDDSSATTTVGFGSTDNGLCSTQRLPDRTSSLPVGTATKSRSSNKDASSSTAMLDALRLSSAGAAHPGAQGLAAQRGNLLLLARGALNDASFRTTGRKGGVAGVELRVIDEGLQDVDLQNTSHTTGYNSRSESKISSKSGIRSEALLSALLSEEHFHTAYENITATALAHFVVGARTNIAEAMIADIAIARYNIHQYGAAVAYFEQLADFYGKSQWSRLEVTMLDMHADSLRNLDRIEEFIRIAMRATILRSCQPGFDIPLRYCLADLFTLSGSLKQPMQIPLAEHFDDIELIPHIQHHATHDGFQTSLIFHSKLPDSFVADEIDVKLISMDPTQSGGLWLKAPNPQELAPGRCQTVVACKVSLRRVSLSHMH